MYMYLHVLLVISLSTAVCFSEGKVESGPQNFVRDKKHSTVVVNHGLPSDQENSGLRQEIESLSSKISSLEAKQQSEVEFLKNELHRKDLQLEKMSANLQTLTSTLHNATNSLHVRGLSRRDVTYEVTQVKHPATVYSNHIYRFDKVDLNTGGGYHAASGVFQAPRSGKYLFWANILPMEGGIHISLIKQGVPMAVSSTHKPYHLCTLTYITEVWKGQRVWFHARHYSRQVYGYRHSSYGGTLIHAY